MQDRRQESSSSATQHMSFATMESTLYKQCPLARPALPPSADDAHNVLQSSRYSQFNGSAFYRGLANPDDLGS